MDEQLDLLAAFRDPQVRELAVKASGLSPQTLKTVLDMVERARELEGLPPATDTSVTGAGRRRTTR